MNKKIITFNRKARYNYHILNFYEAGISLLGTEVKSIRAGNVSLLDGFAQIDDNNEMWLENVYIAEYVYGTWTNHSVRRKRKLLLHKKELIKLSQKINETGLTLIPTEIYLIKGKIKISIALAKGKKNYDKRNSLREKQNKKEADQILKYSKSKNLYI